MARSGEIYLYGDWDKAQFILANLDEIADDNLERAMRESAKKFQKALKRRIEKGDPSWAPLHGLTTGRKGHTRPWLDTGELRGHIKVRRKGKFAYIIGISSTSIDSAGVNISKRALALEYGATIIPKKARMLAIPLNNEAQALQILHGGTGNIPGIIKRKGGKVLFMKEGGTLVPMFVLKNKVTIPPRSLFNKTYKKEEAKIYLRWRRATERALYGKRSSG